MSLAGETITHALTDENIASIADMAIALLQREASDRSILDSLQNQLQSVETALANVMRAIEMGVINSTTQNRMQELERIRDDLSEKIAREADAKPRLAGGLPYRRPVRPSIQAPGDRHIGSQGCCV